MVPDKYAGLGFEISRFGANSQALRYNSKPVFVFGPKVEIDEAFVALICEAYLKTNRHQATSKTVEAG